MTNLSVLNSPLVIIILIIIIWLTDISRWSRSYANCYLCNLGYPGNFGNFIDGAALPTSKKKIERDPDPSGQEAAMTTPLLESQPTKPCKSTTPPEKPLIGDGIRYTQCSSFLYQSFNAFHYSFIIFFVQELLLFTDFK